ncbi:MAG: transglycosylase domain-containing protein, partial [Gammaproteobacteria bacterium]
DWLARLHAAVQNVRARRIVRGASTISEQVVRMLRPRPRTLWSRWLEGFEAMRLERRFGKAAVLEFYLNQVPYASNRRGVVQAARAYFGRSVDTLSDKEMLALSVVVRAPSTLDLHRDAAAADSRIRQLGDRLVRSGLLDARRRAALERPLEVIEPRPPQPAPHFARHVLESFGASGAARITTTLDSEIQRAAQSALDERLRLLANAGVRNAAVLVADHERSQVVAWAVADAQQGGDIDAVTQARQPGSTLKPFVYALALERGWTAATLIDDTPLSQRVGFGQHAYRNYSRRHYGAVSLRTALGNSLNIPAVRTLAFVGPDALLERLDMLGIRGLGQHPDVYGDGLALGNGEVRLIELVGAYAALANRGAYRPLRVLVDEALQPPGSPRRAFSPEVASLIADILSDGPARALEFGRGGALELPVQTAVKTGTSSDHRDAWAVGFNHRFAVGVWMGNLDRRAMRGVTGANGPAYVLRSVFAELNRRGETRFLFLSPRLVRAPACASSRRGDSVSCAELRQEWFLPGTPPPARELQIARRIRQLQSPASNDDRPTIRNPSSGLHLAMDPRIPDARERFVFELDPDTAVRALAVEWVLNGEPLDGARSQRYAWPLERGHHVLVAKVTMPATPALVAADLAVSEVGQTVELDTAPIAFVVK